MTSLGAMKSTLFPVPLSALFCKGKKIFLAIFDVSVSSMFFFFIEHHFLFMCWW